MSVKCSCGKEAVNTTCMAYHDGGFEWPEYVLEIRHVCEEHTPKRWESKCPYTGRPERCIAGIYIGYIAVANEFRRVQDELNKDKPRYRPWGQLPLDYSR